ncbi:hypothetical protein HNY73_010072 [Argiope bruennichi]|uniref:Uncharacterized protein n=1 Tax=Argiope bruennichi TaxID=94029 RepID=A0A8T0F0P4_ARGBR|nr:hypothetical protein HNY73_010072 [Argiope bruennichi]
MDKWTTNMSCDGIELSSDSDLSVVFGETGYKGKIQNTYKRRILPSSSESDSESIEELTDINPRQFGVHKIWLQKFLILMSRIVTPNA